MKKIGIGTILSVALNFFLFFWLVEQYQSDTYFQAYVNATLGPISPFIILTLGVGGGSGLGFFLLKRRHEPSTAIGPRLVKPKMFRPLSSTVASPSSSILNKSSPAGPSLASGSKHTAYSVPSLSKTPSPGGSKTNTGPGSWSLGAKSAVNPSTTTNFPARIDPLTKALQQSPNPRSDEVKSPASSLPSIQRAESPAPAPQLSKNFPENIPRSNPVWRSEIATYPERKTEPMPQFQKPGTDSLPRATSNFSNLPPAQMGIAPNKEPFTPTPTSKWNPPTSSDTPKPSGNQWSSSIRPDAAPPVPSKWAPPANSSIPSQSMAPHSSQSLPVPGTPPSRPGGMIPRPGPLPQGQAPPPRPFVYSGPRLGEPRPMGAPRPIGPEQNRLVPNSIPGQRSLSPQPSSHLQRSSSPSSSVIGPMPQPWSPTQPTEPKPQAAAGMTTPPTANVEPRPSRSDEASASPSLSDTSGTGAGGGEMDWDTALDTILKTLRKDRVGDKA